MRTRVIPTLLIYNGGLVKSVKFKDYKYVGDPMNAVKIFNDKEVDEIVVLDIGCTKNGTPINFKQISEIASEAFMPLAYGGGINKIEDVKKIFFNGVEKVIINKAALVNRKLISEIARLYGSQAIVVSIDVKKTFLSGYSVYTDNGKNKTKLDPVSYAKECEDCGAGEIMLNNIDHDGTYKGYDNNIIKQVSSAVSIPVIAVGGAGNIDDFVTAKNCGASAVAAGSMFVFQRPHQAVLISYPSQKDLKEKLYK